MVVDKTEEAIEKEVSKRVQRPYCTRCGLTEDGAIILRCTIIQVCTSSESQCYVCDDCVKLVMVIDRDQDEKMDKNWVSRRSKCGESCMLCESALKKPALARVHEIQRLTPGTGWTLRVTDRAPKKQEKVYTFCACCLAAVFEL